MRLELKSLQMAGESMNNKKFVITIIILGVVFALFGLLLAMNATGVFDLKAALSNMPVIGNKFKVEDPIMIVSPLEDENTELKKEIEGLKSALSEKDNEVLAFDKERQEFILKINTLEKEIKTVKQKDLQSDNLAQIYGKMDDKQAVKIFNNLDDSTVVGILMKIPSEKTASLLGGMDPMRAAKLTAILTDKAIEVAN